MTNLDKFRAYIKDHEARPDFEAWQMINPCDAKEYLELNNYPDSSKCISEVRALQKKFLATVKPFVSETKNIRELHSRICARLIKGHRSFQSNPVEESVILHLIVFKAAPEIVEQWMS